MVKKAFLAMALLPVVLLFGFCGYVGRSVMLETHAAEEKAKAVPNIRGRRPSRHRAVGQGLRDGRR